LHYLWYGLSVSSVIQHSSVTENKKLKRKFKFNVEDAWEGIAEMQYLSQKVKTKITKCITNKNVHNFVEVLNILVAISHKLLS